MAITAAMVKDLREATGAGMMDAKKALTETDGDFDAAAVSFIFSAKGSLANRSMVGNHCRYLVTMIQY